MYDEMLEHSSGPRPSEYFNDLSYMDAGYLYYYTLDQISLSKERLGEDIERELQVRLTPCVTYVLPLRRFRSTFAPRATSATSASSPPRMHDGVGRSPREPCRLQYGTPCVWCSAKAVLQAISERDSASWSPISRSISQVPGWLLVQSRWSISYRRRARGGRMSGRANADRV